MDNRALQHALEAGGGLGILARIGGDEVHKLFIEVFRQFRAKRSICTPQARMTATASWSSVRAMRRCSSVEYS